MWPFCHIVFFPSYSFHIFNSFLVFEWNVHPQEPPHRPEWLSLSTVSPLNTQSGWGLRGQLLSGMEA